MICGVCVAFAECDGSVWRVASHPSKAWFVATPKAMVGTQNQCAGGRNVTGGVCTHRLGCGSLIGRVGIARFVCCNARFGGCAGGRAGGSAAAMPAGGMLNAVRGIGIFDAAGMFMIGSHYCGGRRLNGMLGYVCSRRAGSCAEDGFEGLSLAMRSAGSENGMRVK